MNDESFVGVPKYIADAVLGIEKLAEGRSETVETEKDWTVVEALFKYWAFADKDDFKRFVDKHKHRVHGGLYNETASVKEKGGAVVRQVGEFPGKFVYLLNSFYPKQKFEEKKFQLKLVNRFPLFKVPTKL